MCLIVHKDTEIKIAKEDITVYKMVKLNNGNYVTPNILHLVIYIVILILLKILIG